MFILQKNSLVVKIMSKPQWTIDQQKAIESFGQNIIVSAGAGSGKTAVLTARIIKILKSGKAKFKTVSPIEPAAIAMKRVSMIT